MKIGLFDSGLGGLLIMKHVAKHLPQYDYEYYGDTAHLPYGDRSEAEIYELTKAGVVHLCAHDCGLVIIACNTASAETLRRLQDEWLPMNYPERRILGVIIPMVEEVVERGLRNALLVATKRTVDSAKYARELQKLDASIKFTQIATPGVVPHIERGAYDAALAELLPHLSAHRGAGGDGVILGCTHYGLLASKLREQLGEGYSVLSQHEIIGTKLQTYLERHPEIAARLTSTGKRNVYLTEHRADYDQFVATILDGRMIVEE